MASGGSEIGELAGEFSVALAVKSCFYWAVIPAAATSLREMVRLRIINRRVETIHPSRHPASRGRGRASAMMNATSRISKIIENRRQLHLIKYRLLGRYGVSMAAAGGALSDALCKNRPMRGDKA